MQEEISYDLVMDDDMAFVEGSYRLPGEDWRVVIVSRGDVAEPAVVPQVWGNGVRGELIRFPRGVRLNAEAVERVLSAALGVSKWARVRGPDSMQLRYRSLTRRCSRRRPHQSHPDVKSLLAAAAELHVRPARRAHAVTAADIHGPWADPGWESGLIARVRGYWQVPIADLPDAGLALFLRQRIAVGPALEEARRRLAAGHPDDSEQYDGELAAAVAQANA
jgi:hypothetical protein